MSSSHKRKSNDVESHISHKSSKYHDQIASIRAIAEDHKKCIRVNYTINPSVSAIPKFCDILILQPKMTIWNRRSESKFVYDIYEEDLQVPLSICWAMTIAASDKITLRGYILPSDHLTNVVKQSTFHFCPKHNLLVENSMFTSYNGEPFWSKDICTCSYVEPHQVLNTMDEINVDCLVYFLDSRKYFVEI